MIYTETLDKIIAHGTMTREQAITLVFHAEDFGSQSFGGVRVTCTEIPDSLRYDYDIHVEI